MRKLCVTLKLHFVIAAVFLVTAAVLVLRPARLQITETHIDLGNRHVGESAQFVIHAANSGGRILHIERVETTCGCISPHFRPTSLFPGDMLTIPVDVKLTMLRGGFRGEISIISDRQSDSNVIVPITAVIKGAVDVRPGQLTLQSEPGAEKLVGRVEIDFSNSPDGAIKSVSFSNAPIQVQLTTKSPHIREVLVSTVDASIPNMLLIETTVPDEDLIMIPITQSSGHIAKN